MFVFGNPVVGGTTLVRPAIKSPNYEQGVSGWALNADGSADLNNVNLSNGSGSTVSIDDDALIFSSSTGSVTSVQADVEHVEVNSSGQVPSDWQFNVPVAANDGFTAGPTAQIGTGATIIEWYSPSADASGLTDYAALSAALSAGYSVKCTPGTFYSSGQLVSGSGALEGCDDGTTFQPGSAWSGSYLFGLANGGCIRNLRGYGGSNTRSANKAAGLVQVLAGTQFAKALDLRSDYMNGWALYGNPVSGSHVDIRSLRGEHNGGGIGCDNGTAGNVAAEWSVLNVDLQNCEVNPIIYLSDVTDFLCSGPINGSILAGAAVKAVDVVGTCQTIHLFGLDVGGSSAASGLVLEANGTGSPSDIYVGPGVVQNAAIGVSVSGAASRLYFAGVTAKNSQTDNWQLSNTGAFCRLIACEGNTGNAGGAGGYDFDFTSTGHWFVLGPAPVSGATTAGIFLAAGNHVTLVDVPSSASVVGTAGGW
jgi:hypothetical protein